MGSLRIEGERGDVKVDSKGSKGSQVSKKRKRPGESIPAHVFRYGNYHRYYGYRLSRTVDEDPRLKLFQREWFEGKKCLDVGCNEGYVTISVAQKFKCRSILGLDIDEVLIGKALSNLEEVAASSELLEDGLLEEGYLKGTRALELVRSTGDGNQHSCLGSTDEQEVTFSDKHICEGFKRESALDTILVSEGRSNVVKMSEPCFNNGRTGPKRDHEHACSGLEGLPVSFSKNSAIKNLSQVESLYEEEGHEDVPEMDNESEAHVIGEVFIGASEKVGMSGTTVVEKKYPKEMGVSGSCTGVSERCDGGDRNQDETDMDQNSTYLYYQDPRVNNHKKDINEHSIRSERFKDGVGSQGAAERDGWGPCSDSDDLMLQFSEDHMIDDFPHGASCEEVGGNQGTQRLTPFSSCPKNLLQRVKFRREDFIEDFPFGNYKKDGMFDTVLCLSITKWIHLNWGDGGLIRLFAKIYHILRPGGRLILEPQPWKSYLRKSKVSSTARRHFNEIVLRPKHFKEILLEKIGFKSVHEISPAVPNSSVGFDRSLFLYLK